MRADLVRAADDRLHLLDLAGLEQDVRHRHEQGPLVDRVGYRLALRHDDDLRAALGVCLVQVADGREVPLLVDDPPALTLELEARDDDRLRDGHVLVHRGRTGRAADDPADLVADRQRHLPPALTPGADSTLLPHARVLEEARLGCRRHRPERVVDQVRRVLEDRELGAVVGELLHRLSSMNEAEFDRLFDEAYLELYAPRHESEQTEAEALGAVRAAEVAPGAEVLDCPCGFGRHSLVLARAGYKVTGADRSQVLLDEARRRAGDVELELVQADYRRLPFDDDRFDAVLNLFSCTRLRRQGGGHASASRVPACPPAGRAARHRDDAPRPPDPHLLAAPWDRLPNGYVLEERSFDQAEGLMRTNFVYMRSSRRAGRVPAHAPLLRALRARRDGACGGFETVDCYGGFDGEELALDARLVLVAG